MSVINYLGLCLFATTWTAAYDNAQILDATSKFSTFTSHAISTVNEIVKATHVMDKATPFIKGLSGALAVAGPVFHAVSAVFSIISFFLPKPDSPELLAIKAGFKEMRERFDRLEKKLDDIGRRMEELFEDAEIHREFVAVIVIYKEKRTQIQTFLRLQKTLVDERTNKSFSDFRAECGNDKPMSLLEWFHQHSDDLEPTLLSAIFKHSSGNLKKLRWFYTIIVSDLTDLSLIRHACLGVNGESKATIGNRVIETEKVMREIYKKMDHLEQKMMWEFHEYATRDIKTILKKYPPPPNVKPQNLVHTDVTNALCVFLSSKYFWLDWLVAVHNALSTWTWYSGQRVTVFDEGGRDVYALYVPDDECDGDFTTNLAKILQIQNDGSCRTDDFNEMAKHYDVGGQIRSAVFLMSKIINHSWAWIGKCFTSVNLACRNKHMYIGIFSLQKGY